MHSGEVQETPEVTRTRKRFARRQWARRWGAWKWLVGAVLVGALLAFGVWVVWFSSLLAVSGVTVTGTGYLTAAEVEDAANVPVGEQLARVDLAAVTARVSALAPVATVDVTRAWPDRVRIAVTERVPVAVVDVGGVVRGMDAEGVLFREYPRAPRDLPVVRTFAGADADARQEAAGVVAAMPAELARRVDHLEVESVDQIRLVLRDGRSVVWGSAADSAEKARVLLALLAHPAQEYDVSVPGQPTTRG
ncbi:MAG TPA: FtsQ-type POTRA domain-containing protein [Nocardioides sp.]|uniref:cell division protein FtsQ/DivIB n=1 Tax=Nocardioides sp. TaxID=35761 RepID=UPI002C3BBA77|nr:FtsQ-type POTRA domain-containing protein [Nocardioides sp.]HQR25795.1 FtsQ-type POTRA domain-containing protein [Nocardioides sp.]